MKPESHLMQERRLLENHIQAFFGRFETILHETSFPGISTDICVIPPSGDRNYHTLVSLGEYSTPSAQTQEQGKNDSILLLLFLPPDWNPNDDCKEQRWPVQLLTELTAAAGCFSEPLAHGTILKTAPAFQEKIPMSHAILLTPSFSSHDGCCCKLPEGKTIHFYQAVPSILTRQNTAMPSERRTS